MDVKNNFWQIHHFLKAFCKLPPAEGNEIVEWVGLRDSKCTLVLQRCWTSKCPQGAPRSLSGTGSAQAHTNLKGLSSWWLVIAGAKDWTIGSVLETRLPFFRMYKAEIGIVKKSHRKGSEDWMAVLPESHRKDHHDYLGEVPHQCCRHPDHYQLRLSLGISSVRWESQSLVSLSTPSRKLTRSRLSVPPAIILPVYFKALWFLLNC